MKVLILTEGGRKIGFGHVTRCLSLYQAFQERKIIPEFLVNSDKSVSSVLKNTNHKLFNWTQEKNRLFEIAKDADIAIVDSYIANFSFYKKISELVKIAVYIDDTKRLGYPKGIVINSSAYAQEIDYPRKDGISYLLGTRYIPIRKSFLRVPEKRVEKNIEKIMLIFGGDDSKGMTPKILRLLNASFPMSIKNVIIGKGYKNLKQTKALKNNNTNLIYYPDAEKIKQVMLKSDLAISAGGQTLFELARVGVPTIAVSVAANQLDNVKGLERTGFLKYAGWWEDKNILERISELIKSLGDEKIRLGMSSLGRRIVDGKGSQRIVRYLLD